MLLLQVLTVIQEAQLSIIVAYAIANDRILDHFVGDWIVSAIFQPGEGIGRSQIIACLTLEL